MPSFIKRRKGKNEKIGWSSGSTSAKSKNHSMWKGLKEILKKKVGLC